METGRRAFIAAAAAVGAALAARGAPALAGSPHLTTDQWRRDLSFLYAGLREHHRNLFHHTPRARFDAAVASLDRRIPRLTPLEIVANLQSIVALAGDGHTFLSANELYRPFPFEAAWFDGDVRIVRTTPEARHLLGMRVDRVDGRPIADVDARLDTTIPQAENGWYTLSQRPDKLRRAELLAALGIARSSGRIAVWGVDMSGRPMAADVEALPAGSSDERLTAVLGPDKPAIPDRSFGWARLRAGEAMHLQFRRYDDLERRAAAFFDDLKAAPPRVLLIDLRDNRGGNYTLPRRHIIEPLQNMSALNRAGRLYVLIGRHTFSAAMTNATDFRRETEALLVGEPTGARPDGYQELHTFLLPNSRIRVACSIRRYRFGGADRDAIYPDLRAAPAWASFSQGRDDAVDAALAHAGATA